MMISKTTGSGLVPTPGGSVLVPTESPSPSCSATAAAAALEMPEPIFNYVPSPATSSTCSPSSPAADLLGDTVAVSIANLLQGHTDPSTAEEFRSIIGKLEEIRAEAEKAAAGAAGTSTDGPPPAVPLVSSFATMPAPVVLVPGPGGQRTLSSTSVPPPRPVALPSLPPAASSAISAHPIFGAVMRAAATATRGGGAAEVARASSSAVPADAFPAFIAPSTSTLAPPAAILHLPQQQHMQSEEDHLCIVCMERRKCIVIVPCGHSLLCRTCLTGIKETSNECPVCRGAIEDSLELTSCLLPDIATLNRREEGDRQAGGEGHL